MGKQRIKKLRRQQQHGMDLEGPVAAPSSGGGTSGNKGWRTGPRGDDTVAQDVIGMDTSEATVVGQAMDQPRQKQQNTKRGARSAKQKQRKRKSLERALAVVAKVDTRTARTGSRSAFKKGLKKLWTNKNESK